MRRWLTRLAVLLLLGAIVNVAVAWAALLIFPPQVDEENEVRLDVTIVAEIVSSRFPAHQIRSSEEYYATLVRRFAWEQVDITCSVDDPATNAYEFIDVLELIAGWPARGFKGRSLWDVSESSYQWALPLPAPVRERTGRLLDFLPLLPIWPGFAINTVLYSAILWLLAFGPFAARRFMRDKRGLCIKCGYDLRGSSGGGGGCPECGWRREAAV